MRIFILFTYFFFVNICNASNAVVDLTPLETYKFGLIIKHTGFVKKTDKEFLLLIQTPRITNEGCEGGGVMSSISIRGEYFASYYLADIKEDSEYYSSQIMARNNDWSDIHVGAAYLCDGLGTHYDFGTLKELVKFYEGIENKKYNKQMN